MSVKRRGEELQELNLVPIMNLVTILIPFLLMAAQFVHLAVIDSTLPAIGPPTPPEEQPEKPPLSLSLGLMSKGLMVLGADAVLNPGAVAAVPDATADPGEGINRPPTVPCKSGGECTSVDDYDWKELTRILGLIKDEYPDDENVIMVPDQHLQYEILIKAMDSSRSDPDVKVDGKPRTLFPFVVIAGGAI